jgi:peptidoglycan hydrolase-like protein with peptidoglycan-binding domain
LHAGGRAAAAARFVVPVLAVVALLLAVGAAEAGVLKKGSRGARVGAVQKALGLKADRVFGPATRRAVKRFQRRHGLTADGIVGPVTWSLIKQVRAGQRARRASSRGTSSRARTRGSSVRRLQSALGIRADGVFGPATARAVRAFQRSHGLTPDGVVGPATWAALGHPNARVVLKRGRGGSGGGGMPSTVLRVIRGGTRIAHKPYKYGGGHGRWNDTGYDCSGSVSYALHGGGLLSRALSAGDFMSWGSPGKGRWITIYARPGHVYMVVNGRRFDTTGRDSSGGRWQHQQRSSMGYVVRHPTGL